MDSLNKAALERFDPKKHHYIRVVKKDGSEHLIAEKKCCLGRLWMKLRGNSSNYSANKIATFVNSHFEDLRIETPEEMLLIEKLNIYLNSKPARAGTKFHTNTYDASIHLIEDIYRASRELLDFLENAKTPMAINNALGLGSSPSDVVHRTRLLLQALEPRHYTTVRGSRRARRQRLRLESYQKISVAVTEVHSRKGKI